jgi:hypothetical protein
MVHNIFSTFFVYCGTKIAPQNDILRRSASLPRSIRLIGDDLAGPIKDSAELRDVGVSELY